MEHGQRLRFVAILGLVVALMTAGIGLATDAPDHPSAGAPVTCRTTDDRVENATSGESEACGEDEADDEGGSDERQTESSDRAEPADVDPERERRCLEAATPHEDEGDETGDTDASEEAENEKLTGLENSIDHVLENCMKNGDAPGLITALDHLVGNMERKADHLEWLDERRAEREAAKAAREAVRTARKASQAAAGTSP